MSISERLQMVIKMNGMTNSTFADEIGVQRSSISHVLAGRNKPSIDFIQKILDTFPKVDANWLVTGKKIGRTMDPNVKQQDEKGTYVLPPEQIPGSGTDTSTPSREDSDKAPSLDQKVTAGKTIQKVVIFYKDGTYEELGNN